MKREGKSEERRKERREEEGGREEEREKERRKQRKTKHLNFNSSYPIIQISSLQSPTVGKALLLS